MPNSDVDYFAYRFGVYQSLAPHIIIFRVTTGRSWGSQVPRWSNDREVVSAPINFVHCRTVDSAEPPSVHPHRVNEDASNPGVESQVSRGEHGGSGPVVAGRFGTTPEQMANATSEMI